MPYALLANALPAARMGVYMGIFNLFIVLPEIVASLGLGWVVHHELRDNRLLVVVVGGASMLLAAVLMRFVEDPAHARRAVQAAPGDPAEKQAA